MVVFATSQTVSKAEWVDSQHQCIYSPTKGEYQSVELKLDFIAVLRLSNASHDLAESAIHISDLSTHARCQVAQ